MCSKNNNFNDIIAIVATLALTLLVLASCRAPQQLTSSRQDSIYIERTTTVRDTIVRFVPQSEEHSVITDSVSHLETSLAVSDAAIIGGMLQHSLSNKVEPIELTIPIYTEREYRFVGQDISTTVVVEKEKPLKNWQRTLMGIGLLAIGYIVAKIINKCSGGQILGFIRKFFSFHV